MNSSIKKRTRKKIDPVCTCSHLESEHGVLGCAVCASCRVPNMHNPKSKLKPEHPKRSVK